MSIILGVDPGLQKTGWGIISVRNNALSFLGSGTIRTKPADAMPVRLKTLHEGLSEVIAHYRPDVAAVEETFINKNAASSLKLGQARGAILLSLQLAGLPLYEYAATLVKKSVVGTGHAQKDQIGMMVRTLLPASDAKSEDAADALAVAICHSSHMATRKAVAGASA